MYHNTVDDTVQLRDHFRLHTYIPDGSGRRIRMIRMSVLWRQVSHLLLIRTNLGYGTV
jgi:hypothetical protein